MSDQGRILSKYINKIMSGRVAILAFSANGGTGDLTSSVTSVLSTAGHNNTAVPLQVSGGVNSEGLIATGSLNRVAIRVDDAIVDDGTGLEVYGRLTESTGTYTLTYYVNDGGVETAYSFASATDVDVYVPYRFTFGSYPGDSLVALPTFDAVADPIAPVTPTPISHTLTVTGDNTLSSLSFTPFAGTKVTLFCMGVAFSETESPAPFTVTGQTITWNASNAGVTLKSTEDTSVVASYFY